MSKFKILGVVLLFTFGGGQSLFAQAAISEPGAYAFYHPDADVLNAGRPDLHWFEPANAFARDQVSSYGASVSPQPASPRRHRK